MGDSVEVSRDIGASPDAVWDMVSDVTRMGEWSPENDGGEWLKGATGPTAGSRFRGANHNGRRRWKTTATVTDAEPGRRFSFRVSVGPLTVADWGYAIEPTGAGCRVTESWTDLRPGFFKPIARLATGVADRAARNRSTMQTTLENLAEAAEATAEETETGEG